MIYISVSAILIKIIGVILAIAGLFLVLAAVGVHVLPGVGFEPAWLEVIVGLVLIGAGIIVVRGGNITL